MNTQESFDSYVFHEGTNYRAYSYFGQHPAVDAEGNPCTVFRVWAPHAWDIKVIGDFNGWQEWNAIQMVRMPDV